MLFVRKVLQSERTNPNWWMLPEAIWLPQVHQQLAGVKGSSLFSRQGQGSVMIWTQFGGFWLLNE